MRWRSLPATISCPKTPLVSWRAIRQAGFDDERRFDLSAAKRVHEMDGAPAAGRQPGPFLVYRLSDAAQFELLVDVRRYPHLHAWRADHYRRRAGDALHAACRFRLRFGRGHYARRQLRLV